MPLSYHFVLPPTGPADNAIVREMFDDVKAFVDNLTPSGSAAPVDATYLTLSTNATLTNERVLTAGTAISFTDNGAGSTLVVNNIGVTALSTTNINSNFSSSTGNITFSFASTPTFISVILGLLNQVGITPSASAFTSYNLTLPLDGGTNGYLLSTNGATPTATLSWVPNNGGVTSVHGTTDQISVSSTTGSVTFSTPQDIATSSSPTFAALHLAVIPGTGLMFNTSPVTAYQGSATALTLEANGTAVIVATGNGSSSTVALNGTLGLIGDATISAHRIDLTSNSGNNAVLTLSNAATNKVTVKPNSSFTSYTLVLPPDDGNANDVLISDGSGNLSFVAASTVSGGASTALSNLASVAINTSLISDTDNTDSLGSSSIQWASVESRIVNVGSSGKVGTFQVFPATASKGAIIITAVNNSGNFNLTLTNAVLSASRVYTFPEVSADASFVMTEGAQTINGAKTFASSALKLQETGSTDTVTLAVPSLASSYTLTLPVDDGTSGQVLSTDGSGTLSWIPTNTSLLRNRIMNGEMRLDQRNEGGSTTINATSTEVYTLDRWLGTGQTTDGVFTIVRSTSTPPTNFTHFLRVTVTTADSSIGATQQYLVRQYIEGSNCYDLLFGTASAKTITVSFWVRSSVTGTMGGTINNSAENRNYPFTYAVNAANTWEQKSIVIAGDTSGTWLTDTGKGLILTFSLGTGSTRSATAGSWSSTSSIFSATGAVGVISTNSSTWDVTGVQLEAASIATDFEYRPEPIEIGLCQRYYEKSLGFRYSYSGINATGFAIPIHFNTVKRATPTITVNGGTTINVSSVNSESPNTRGFTYIFASSATALNAIGNSDDATWIANAEL